MQSVSINTGVVSSNIDQGEVHNMMWLSLSVTCDMSVVFSTNKADRHDITEILLKVALNTKKKKKPTKSKILLSIFMHLL